MRRLFNKNKMRIAFIVPSLANKGPILIVKELCEYLVNKGNICKVFFFDNITELEMPCQAELLSFKQIIDFTQWDIIHSHMLRPDFWVFFHKPLLKKCSTKFITTIHQNIFQTLIYDYGCFIGFFTGIFWKFILTKFNHIVVLTNEHKKTLKYIKKEKISIIYNGRNIDINKTVEKKDIDIINAFRSKYKKIIGTNSIITKRKGLEQIINTLPLLPDIGYIIVGDGPEQGSLKRLAKQLRVDNQCLWLGVKPNGYRYTALFDVYLILSRSEGFPLSLIEAAAWGKPVICSDIPILKGIFNSEQVTFTPLDKPALLAKNINEVITNNQGREIALNKFYKEKLTSEKMCQNYINLYESI